MRRWTQARFARAVEGCAHEDVVVWLPSRDAAERAAHASRLGRAARICGILGLGCAASGILPQTAFAPIGSASASVGDIRLRPLDPVDDVSVQPAGVEAAPLFRPSLGEADPAGSAIAPPGDGLVRLGGRAVPRRLVDEIVRAAARTAVDANYLLALADTESGFRPTVRAATSSAQGLFQFIDRTWLEIVKSAGAEHGLAAEADAIAMADERPVVADAEARARILALRDDPYLAAVMAAELLKRDAAQIGFRIGRQLSETELYLAHFLGFQDAARFIEARRHGSAPAASRLFPAAARANAPLFFASRRKTRRSLSVGEVYGRLDRLIAPRVERFRRADLSGTAGEA